MSAAFDRWFGNSQVIDYTGAPLVVWHASPEEFTIFNTNREGAHFGTREQAENRLHQIAAYLFSGRGWKKKLDKLVRPFFLSIQNPLRMPDIGVWSEFSNLHASLARQDIITMKEADEIWAEWQKTDDLGWAKLKDILRRKGFDGIVYENELEGNDDSWIAFEASQIKSTKNDGSFNLSDPDVMSNPPSVTLEQVNEVIRDTGYYLERAPFKQIKKTLGVSSAFDIWPIGDVPMLELSLAIGRLSDIPLSQWRQEIVDRTGDAPHRTGKTKKIGEYRRGS